MHCVGVKLHQFSMGCGMPRFLTEEQALKGNFKSLKWCLISSWRGLYGVVASDKGALKQIIHQVPCFLFIVVFPWQVHTGIGSMVNLPGHWASANLYCSQDCFWPLFTDRTNEVCGLNRAIKIKKQMKAVSDVLNPFKTASRGFLNSNKFKLSFTGSHGQWDMWVKSLCRGSDPAGRSQEWFSWVFARCYNLVRFFMFFWKP